MENLNHSGQILRSWDNELKAMKKYPAYYDADQLYDLEADPKEQNNLAYLPEYKTILKDLKSELQLYLEKLPGGFGEFKKDEFENYPSRLYTTQSSRAEKRCVSLKQLLNEFNIEKNIYSKHHNFCLHKY